MLPNKTMLYVSGLVLAVAGPVSVFSGADMLAGVKKSWFAAKPAANAQQPSSGTSPELSPSIARYAADNSPASASSTYSPEIAPMPRLDEVLRFDVTVEWVMRRWPRVSTGSPYLQLQGYRVPLVTGTSPADLAGSLTYYFNSGQQVDRITFRGTTGDPGRLVMLVGSRFHFARRLTNDPGIVLFEAVDSGNKPIGSLKIRSAAVIKASDPYSRYQVDLVIDRA